MSMYGILLSHLGWCPNLLLGIVRQAAETNMHKCWSLTCCFSWTLGSSLKCGKLSLLTGISMVDVLQNWLKWFHFLFSRERSTHYSVRSHDFSANIPRCYKDVYVSSFFPGSARLWDSLSVECLHLSYNLNGYKSRITRHLLTANSL